MEAYEILELMCELLAERLSLIAHDKACPPELIGSVHTLIWAAPRTEVSEFKAVRAPLLSPSLLPLLSSPPSPLSHSLSLRLANSFPSSTAAASSPARAPTRTGR